MPKPDGPHLEPGLVGPGMQGAALCQLTRPHPDASGEPLPGPVGGRPPIQGIHLSSPSEPGGRRLQVL